MTSELRAERTGVRRGIATNGRGASLTYGPIEQEGSFTPGELLALALAACNLMSADHVLGRRLGGPDGELTASATVATVKNAEENRYVDAQVDIAVDPGALGALDEQAVASLRTVLGRAIDRNCTVGRTVEAGLPHTLTVNGAT